MHNNPIEVGVGLFLPRLVAVCEKTIDFFGINDQNMHKVVNTTAQFQ